MGNEAYTQSTALLRYAGKLGGLYPEDPLAALKVCKCWRLAWLGLPVAVAMATVLSMLLSPSLPHWRVHEEGVSQAFRCPVAFSPCVYFTDSMPFVWVHVTSLWQTLLFCRHQVSRVRAWVPCTRLITFC